MFLLDGHPIKEGTVPKSEEKKITQNQSQVKPEDFMLTQKENVRHS